MKPIIRSHQIAAALSFLLLFATVGALIVFINKIHAREQLVLGARDRLAAYEQNKRKLSEEGVQLDALKKKASALETNIVTEDSVPTVLSAIESMAKQNSLDFTLTSVAATSATPSTPSNLKIDFSADGSFTAIQHFISQLLSQPYQVRVSRMSIYAVDGAKGSTSWQLLAGIEIISF